MNIYDLLAHIKGLFIRHEAEWINLSQRNYTWRDTLVYYAIPLLFISSFAGILSINHELTYFTLSPSWTFFVIFSASVAAIVLAAYMITAMTPRFKGKPSFDRTVVLISFSYTPVLFANVISSIHSTLQFFNFVGLLFMIFLFWRGSGIMLEIPRFKQTGFSIISLLMVFAVRVLVAAVLAAIVMGLTGNIPDTVY